MAFKVQPQTTIRELLVLGMAMSIATLAATVSVQADILSGRYLLKPSTIETEFSVRVLGAESVKGRFRTATGEMLLDAKRPEASRVRMTVDLTSVETNNKRITSFLKSRSMFDVARHPVADFESTSVRLTGNRSAQIDGFLKLRGQRKRASLDVLLAPVGKSQDISIQAKGGFFEAFLEWVSGCLFTETKSV